MAAPGSDGAAGAEAGERESGKRSLAGYETEMFKFTQEQFPNVFQRDSHFGVAKAFRANMVAAGLWESFEDAMDSHCDYMSPELDYDQIYHTHKFVLDAFAKHPWLQANWVLPALLCSVPTDLGVPHLFKKRGDVKSLSGGFTVVANSTVYAKLVEAEAAAAAAAQAAQATGKAKAKATSKRKRGASTAPKAEVPTPDKSSSKLSVGVPGLSTVEGRSAVT
eukprot:14506664-Alexandrium_andersonii.AAC.1